MLRRVHLCPQACLQSEDSVKLTISINHHRWIISKKEVKSLAKVPNPWKLLSKHLFPLFPGEPGTLAELLYFPHYSKGLCKPRPLRMSAPRPRHFLRTLVDSLSGPELWRRLSHFTLQSSVTLREAGTQLSHTLKTALFSLLGRLLSKC